jgi:cobalt-zinc-cadmium efflux system outer membrane protein
MDPRSPRPALRGAAVLTLLLPPLVLGSSAARAAEDLPSPLSLAEVLAAVRRQNPQAAERRASAEAAALRPRAEGLPDDPMVMLEWWQQPVNFQAVPLMVTARQKVPFASTLRLRRQVAERDGRVAGDEADEALRRVEAEAKRAYFDRLLAERSLEVLARVRAIAAELVEVTAAVYGAGKAQQSDLWKAQSELLVIDNDRADLERSGEEAAARLNALLDRPVNGALPPLATGATLVALPAEADLIARALGQRPEVRRARDRLTAAQARLELAGREALPELSVWASYMVMVGGVDTFTAGVSSSLPVFAARRRTALRDAGAAEVEAARQALAASQRETELAVHAALLQLETAGRHVHLHADKLVPLADLALASTQTAYRAGRADFLAVLDSARMVRDHHQSHIKFLVEYRRKLADLEQLAGDLDEAGARP